MKLAPWLIVASLGAAPAIASAQVPPKRSDPFRGPIDAAVQEPVQKGTRPRIILALKTVNAYPCYNYKLDARLKRTRDTLGVTLHGLLPAGICAKAIGPAHAGIALPQSPGTYALTISRGDHTDSLQLIVSAKRIDLRARGQLRFIRVDTSTFWRPHPRSFLLSCGAPNAPELCADLAAWLGRQPGVRPKPLPTTGRIGFVRYGGTSDGNYHYRLYEYDGGRALQRVRRCMRQVAAAVAEAVGVDISLETAAGERMTAWSRRSLSDKHVPTPRRIAGGPGCP